VPAVISATGKPLVATENVPLVPAVTVVALAEEKLGFSTTVTVTSAESSGAMPLVATRVTL